jgi:hypothetical protein
MNRLLSIILLVLSEIAFAGDSFMTMTPCYLSGSSTACLKPVNVAGGGTGLSSGTSGGIPYFSSTSAMTSSALLTANAVMIGGGAGIAPSTIAADSTTTRVLHGGSPPSFGAIASGDLPAASSSAQGAVSYEDKGTFSATFTGPCSSGAQTIKYSRVGENVCLILPAFTCSSSSSTSFSASSSVPSGLRPSGTTAAFIDTASGGGNQAAITTIDSSGNWTIYKDAGGSSFAVSGTVGIQYNGSICYTAQ